MIVLIFNIAFCYQLLFLEFKRTVLLKLNVISGRLTKIEERLEIIERNIEPTTNNDEMVNQLNLEHMLPVANESSLDEMNNFLAEPENHMKLVSIFLEIGIYITSQLNIFT